MARHDPFHWKHIARFAVAEPRGVVSELSEHPWAQCRSESGLTEVDLVVRVLRKMGVHRLGELVDLGVKAGIVEKSGAWFSYNSQRLGQGRENAKQFLRDNPDAAYAIEDKIRASHGLDFGASAEDDALTED